MLDPDSTISSAPSPESKNAFALTRLRRACIGCELLPGSTASEAEIAERFGLGRAAVRAALARLEVEGFVCVAPRAGWVIAPITAASVGEVVSAWMVFARSVALVSMSSEAAQSLARIARQADALGGRCEVEVLNAARRLWSGFVAELAAPQGRLVSGWVLQCNDLTQRLTHWFERRNPRWMTPALSRVADQVVLGDMAAAAQEMERVVLARRAWLVDCLMRADDLVFTPAAASPEPRQTAKSGEQPYPAALSDRAGRTSADFD